MPVHAFDHGFEDHRQVRSATSATQPMRSTFAGPLDRGLDASRLVERHGSPLLVLDCEALRGQYRALSRALPGVRLHYAIKALPEVAAVSSLAQLGSHFEIASEGEIELLREAGVGAGRTIHTHPIKRPRDIVAALRFGVTTFVVDNTHELDKMIGFRERADVLLRVRFRSPDARCDLSRKFGCAPQDVASLVDRATTLGIRVKGLCFHVGSQSATPDAHVGAIHTCAEMIRSLRESGAQGLRVLDIGGGFPVNYDGTTPSIDAFCAPIRTALARLPGDVEVIAEPGRFLAAPAMTGIATVIGKAEREGRLWYFLDDGVYGSYSGRIYDHTRYPIEVARRGPTRESVLAGPTCDSIDVIEEDIPLPLLEIGDLVVGRMMGAYTSASATQFNSLPRARILVLNVPIRTRDGAIPAASRAEARAQMGSSSLRTTRSRVR